MDGGRIEFTLSQVRDTVVGNDLLYTSNAIVEQYPYYDTSLRPHLAGKFQGNWGVYPFLPSGKILASDMQEGLFVFDKLFPLGLNDNKEDDLAFIVYPNPAKENITITTTLFDDVLDYTIVDLHGRMVKEGVLSKAQTRIRLNTVSPGFYVFSITKHDGSIITKKFIKE